MKGWVWNGKRNNKHGFAESSVYLQCHMKLTSVVGRSSSPEISQRLWNSSRISCQVLPSFRMCSHSSLIWHHEVMLVQEEGYPKVLGWYLRQLPRCYPGHVGREIPEGQSQSLRSMALLPQDWAEPDIEEPAQFERKGATAEITTPNRGATLWS